MAVARADLHVHTRVSDGLATVERTLEHIERETAIDIVAITDHEDVRGGLEARELAARRGYRVQVVVGAEVTTLQGHLICLGIERTPKSFRSIEATVAAVHDQGGLAIAPHPGSWLTRSLSFRTIDRIAHHSDPGLRLDAVETANPSPAGLATRARVLERNARRWQLPEVGSSDGHHLPHIGTGWCEFEGETVEDLFAAIRGGTVRPMMSRYPKMREVGLMNLAAGLAWGYTATPRKVLGPMFGGRR